MRGFKAYLSWSSGKDSAFALWETRQRGLAEVAGLLTTFNAAFGRAAMHGVRRELIARQAAETGLPMLEVPLPWPCSNTVYERRMAAATDRIKAEGATHLVFGDLHLEDIRAYRDAKLKAVGMGAIYPLWKRDTGALARAMIDSGLVAWLVCIDPTRLDRRFAGRRFDHALLAELPGGVDPCGENGEFHTLVTAGPMFAAPIPVAIGEVVERDGFVFADATPA